MICKSCKKSMAIRPELEGPTHGLCHPCASAKLEELEAERTSWEGRMELLLVVARKAALIFDPGWNWKEHECHIPGGGCGPCVANQDLEDAIGKLPPGLLEGHTSSKGGSGG